MINAKILLDSVNASGSRLTTWVLTYPRFIHAEFMTHRVFSRNASSSRAIPVKKMIEDVKTNPAMPVFWGKNQSGMQAAEELDNIEKKHDVVTPYVVDIKSGLMGKMIEPNVYTDMEMAKQLWLKARDNAVATVEKMVEVGLHKQIANRILEPWMHITVIATATEHENFFSLRAHKDAQPEFQELAYLMLKLYQDSTPKEIKNGDWHIPFGDMIDEKRILEGDAFNKGLHPAASSWDMEQLLKELTRKIATARCARVSYLNFEGKDDYEADIALADRLSQSGHWSPFEHCAYATPHTRNSNFVGWTQYRKMFSQENRNDGRVQRYNENKE